MEIILASASPRRKEIMTLLGLQPEVIPAYFEPEIDDSLPLDRAVMEVAKAKAEQVSLRYPHSMIIGADTVVAAKQKILGKPQNESDAADMLRTLSGITHTVYTGVWVCSPYKNNGFTETTEVSFCVLSEGDIAQYIATGDPLDKAGAYGIQSYGLRFVKKINGDFYNVMGLPASALWQFLKKGNYL